MLAALLYLRGIALLSAPYAGGADSSGYMNIARGLQRGQVVAHVPQIEGLRPPEWDYFWQQPLGFSVAHDTGRMVPTYSVGLPLHLLLAAPFVTLDYAGVIVNIACALLGAVLMLALARQLGLSWLSGLAGVAILWACPLCFSYEIQMMSDAPAMVWAMAALLFGLLARRHTAWALAAGFAVGVAVLVRPTNLLLVVPVGILLGLRWQRWAALVAGGLPCAVFLALYNSRLYGAALTSGYGDVSSSFNTEFARHNLRHFFLWIPRLLTPPVVLAGVLWAWLGRKAGVATWALASWVILLFGFYLFYFHTGETWWYLRFLLPAFPALILAALLTAQTLLRHVPARASRIACGVVMLLFVVVLEVLQVRRLEITPVKHGELTYPHTAEWLEKNVPKNSILFVMQVSGALAYYTDYTLVRWDHVKASQAQLVFDAAKKAKRPVYAALFNFEEERAFAESLGHHWRVVQTIGSVRVWQHVD